MKKACKLQAKNFWWRRGGSNSRPSHCERDALPAELLPHAKISVMGNRIIGKVRIINLIKSISYDYLKKPQLP
jgi:hypothetical protein